MANPSTYSRQPGFKDVWQFAWFRLASKSTYVFALLLGFGQTFIMMLFPLIDNLYFDMLEAQQYGDLQFLLPVSTFVIVVLLILILIGEYFKKSLTTQLDMDVSQELLDHAQRLPMEVAQGTHSSDLVQRVTRDSQRSAGFLTLIADQMTNQIVMFALALVYVMWLNWKIGAALLVISPLILTASHLLRNKANIIGQRIAEQESVVRACQQDALQNIELIKVYGIEDWIEKRCTSERKQLNALYMSRFWWQQLVVLTSSTFIDLMVIGTMIAVGWMALHGTMTIGALVAFSTLVWRLNDPLKTLTLLWTRMHGEIGGSSRVFALLSAEKEPVASPANETESNGGQGVVLHRIHYSYLDQAGLPSAMNRDDEADNRREQQRPKLLENFSLRVAPGSFTAIVGPSGSGKSTIARIAAGLLLPFEGDVSINGREVRQDMESARASVAYVPQLPFLFSGSVRDNLQAVNAKANMEDVEQAASLALAHEFIEALSNQYETNLKEHGGSLSGGQKQRLAIARAIVANRSIWILDEMTSALDVRTEEQIMRQLIPFIKQRNHTMIVVAHRLSTIRNADEIIVVHGGQIVQRGRHEQLIREENGWYQQMWMSSQ
jgi:ABC-type multidrug transport system fused ATPase/permease subunit